MRQNTDILHLGHLPLDEGPGDVGIFTRHAGAPESEASALSSRGWSAAARSSGVCSSLCSAWYETGSC